MGDSTAIASPTDGCALVLEPTAAVVWEELLGWRDEPELTAALAKRYPDVGLDELRAAVEEIVGVLDRAGALERST